MHIDKQWWTLTCQRNMKKISGILAHIFIFSPVAPAIEFSVDVWRIPGECFLFSIITCCHLLPHRHSALCCLRLSSMIIVSQVSFLCPSNLLNQNPHFSKLPRASHPYYSSRSSLLICLLTSHEESMFTKAPPHRVICDALNISLQGLSWVFSGPYGSCLLPIP